MNCCRSGGVIVNFETDFYPYRMELFVAIVNSSGLSQRTLSKDVIGVQYHRVVFSMSSKVFCSIFAAYITNLIII